MRTILYVLFLLLSFAGPVSAANFLVKNANATGADSFVQAIADANAAGAGPHTITFTATVASGSTVYSSDPSLYQITNSNVTIDGGGRNVTLRAAGGITIYYGLTFTSSANNCTIKGLSLVNFYTAGVYLNGATGTTIIGCRFNTNPTATASIPVNMNYGVYGSQAHSTKIGGSILADRNYFAAIASSALYFIGCKDVVITGNFFGVTSTTNALFTDSNFKALHLENCSGAIVGRGTTAAERNLFCGSSAFEIEIVGTGTNANILTNNYFGYDASGAALTYYVGIKFTGASNNLIQNNRFGGTYSTPINATGTYIGNKLRQNSFESHSGDPPTGIINANVRAPEFYSASSTIVKGLAHPGDSIEIYYANSYVLSGLTYIDRVLVPPSGEWSLTGTFIVGKAFAITATNNTNKTTSWFTTSAGIGSGTIYACANTPNISTVSVCKTANLGTVGFYPSGYLGTTTPANAGIWTASGTGTFTNGGLYSPSLTKYIPSAADIIGGTMNLILTTLDTNCVNNSYTMGMSFVTLPVLNQGSDKFTCNNSTSLTGTPSQTTNSWYAIGPNASSASITNGGTNSPSITFSAAGTYNIVRSAYLVAPGPAVYCYNYDTVTVYNKPNPVPPTGVTLTTTTQVPVTYTVPSVPGEILSVYYYPPSASPSAYASVTSSGSTLTYVTSGTYFGPGSFSYTISNQCSNSTLGSVNVTVKNAAPVTISPGTVTSTRGGQNTVVIYIPNYAYDINNDLNLNSFQIQKVASGATFSYNTPSSGYVTINYATSSGAADFVGLDSVRFLISDGALPANTTQGRILIERARNLSTPATEPEDIIVYNGISPDGDGINDFLHIVNLADYANTVTIYDRWGDKVWEGKNYNNTTVRFEGNRNIASVTPLPNGTYFFVIKNESKSDNGEKSGLTSGYVVIRRDQ